MSASESPRAKIDVKQPEAVFSEDNNMRKVTENEMVVGRDEDDEAISNCKLWWQDLQPCLVFVL